jgi:hypothetical protein
MLRRLSRQAQSGTASIDGRVTDQQGAVVPGATSALRSRRTVRVAHRT